MSVKIFRDEDVSTNLVRDKLIAVLGYGNQGRAQALNLRDSGFNVIVGNRNDPFELIAQKDGFEVFSIHEAAEKGEILILLIPDEVQPEVYRNEIKEFLDIGDTLVFASGFNIAFKLISPPSHIDVIMVAPRMIGEGVRENYLKGIGFPTFIGVAQDYTDHAREVALEIAKGIGSTKMGALEVSFKQEAELDLFTEQCFTPAMSQVLSTAIMLLVNEGYPAPAVLLELYLSGELSYTFKKAAELGLIDQMKLHSRTSQYGSMTRAVRFSDFGEQLKETMKKGLNEIQSGVFTDEWINEKEAGYPTLEEMESLLEANPLRKLEKETLKTLAKRE
ncbi:MAG: ketol-acid reductoisomerase [Candidatus Hodarchaeota archaeon]